MRAAWLIAAKDLRQRLRDRSALLIGVRAPARAWRSIFSSIFSGVAGAGAPPSTRRRRRSTAAPSARPFTGQVLRPLERERAARPAHVEAPSPTARRLADAATVAAVDRHPGAASRPRSRRAARPMQVIGNVDAPSARRSPVDRARLRRGAERSGCAVATAAAGGSPARRGARRPAAASAPSRSRTSRPRPSSSTRTPSSPPAWPCSSSSSPSSSGSTSLLEERSDGTLARLLAAPVRRGSILGGKLLTSVALGHRRAWPCWRWRPSAVRRALGQSARRRGC